METILSPFTRKALITIVLAALAVIALTALFFVAEMLLVCFGALLIALVLRGLGDWLARHTPLSSRLAVILVIATLLGLTGLAGWLLAPGLGAQFTTLGEQMPLLLEGARDWLNSFASLRAPREQLEHLLADNTETLVNVVGGPLRALLYVFIALVSGVFFSESLFGKALSFNHKTVFAILSWLIFAALLAGRHLRGWRGRVALRWTLAGFVALLLAYVGSRFVLEVIL